MFGFVFRKISNKKWMVLSLLLGNLLMVGIAAASPMYSRSILQRTLIRRLNDSYVELNQHPGTIHVSGLDAQIGKSNEEYYDRLQGMNQILEECVTEMGVPLSTSAVQFYKTSVKAAHETALEEEENEVLLRMTSCADVTDHINMVYGEMYQEELDGDTFDVIVNESTFVKHSLMLGEVLELVDRRDTNGNPYRVRIAGIFEAKDIQDPYWVSNPAKWKDVCLMNEELFQQLFVSRENKTYKAEWKKILDYTAMRTDQIGHYLKTAKNCEEKLKSIGFRDNLFAFVPVLEEFEVEAKKLNTTIIVLQMPIFVLLAAFIFMVSGQMLEMEQNEISVYKSRGADKKQIILLYLLQSVLISAVSMAGGIPLGVVICKVLGASNSFLEFVKRTSLAVEMGPEVWMYAGIAAIFSVCTMVLPVMKYANVNIVDHKRNKNRSRAPWWQKCFLDIILLAAALYGWNHYTGQKAFLVQQVLEGASLEPLLYFCSSLFMMGAGLLILRIFPIVVRAVFEIGKRWWTPSFYASFLRIMRTRSNQSFLMVFLILTMAMGVFNAQAARTINANGEDRIRYSIGADLVLQEQWIDNSASIEEDSTGKRDVTYIEPDFEKYETMDGVAQATKVLVNHDVKVAVEDGFIRDAMVMGIHTKEFGEIAWYKNSLIRGHWYEYLNAIAQDAQAILVSENFRTVHGYELGDMLTYTNADGKSAYGVIYGFVDYWPAYSPVVQIQDKDGILKDTDQFLIVANLSQLQSSWGITPYQVWIRTEGSAQFIYDYAETSGIKFAVFQDTAAEIVKLKNDPVFQGTNGVLTVGFVCVLLVCITGFLIYWILSIQSRTLQFGIFSAMGMRIKEILLMLVNEQIFITGISILAGTGIGIIASKLYVPLIQIAYTSADQVIPMEIIGETGDYIRLFTVVGIAILICMFILGWLISKIKIAQALKLGED